MTSFYFKGQIATESALLENHYLIVSDGIIESISSSEPSGIPKREIDGDGDIVILPGFRDPHTHDVNGQLAAPTQSKDEIAARLSKVMKAYAGHGVTAVYLATFGAGIEHLVHYSEAAKAYMDDERNGVEGARLMGMNIEGSFLNRECRGAQPAEFCITPETHNCIEAIDRLADTGAVRMMNIVPDYGEASLQAIRHARSKGILVGSGHLKPPAELLHRAYHECGLQYMVHFTNGPTGQSFKPFGGGGAFEGAMDIPIVKELILDLVHIDRRYVLDMIRRNEERWGDDKIIAITDASFPITSELPEGNFQIGSTIAVKDHDANCLRAVQYIQENGSKTDAPPNTLCGSILSMDQACSHLVTLFTQEIEGHWYAHPAIPLEKALIQTAKLCATHQSKLDGSYDRTGSIAAGKQADLTIGTFSRSENTYRFQVLETMRSGNPLSCFML